MIKCSDCTDHWKCPLSVLSVSPPRIRRGYSWRLSRPSLRRKRWSQWDEEPPGPAMVLNNGRSHVGHKSLWVLPFYYLLFLFFKHFFESTRTRYAFSKQVFIRNCYYFIHESVKRRVRCNGFKFFKPSDKNSNIYLKVKYRSSVFIFLQYKVECTFFQNKLQLIFIFWKIFYLGNFFEKSAFLNSKLFICTEWRSSIVLSNEFDSMFFSTAVVEITQITMEDIFMVP